MLRQLVFALPALILLGCQAESEPLPHSQNLAPEKVAAIAATIKNKYPNLSSELRGKVLNTVVQSIDNMVFVEDGQFDMGDFGWMCEYDEKDVCTWPCGQDPEQLCNISSGGDDDFVHPVKLSSYYLSKFQVALGNFDLFFVANGKPLFDAKYRDREDLKDILFYPVLPAPTQSWQEAKDYCQWIGQLSGYPVDLPSEAQWEYAARSRGEHVLFPTDTGSLSYGENFPMESETAAFPVKRFPPNPLGLYGMSGNATDWVNDWYGKDYYQHSPLEYPQGPDTGTKRIKRGSNYSEASLFAAPIVRRWAEEPDQGGHYQGNSFRCAIQSDRLL
ncbi:SUMF1/EgtB/PvdO family nonheme iron enzyme [Pseudomonas sp. ANT_J28]|uniref:formylglycine-generating enzyme family protein n=1 Tax=Pseudomonas sp. ANT_J28 TaxID=2597352 RepID=UPI0011F1B6F2|nr:SUMF1/EgtB/PvdO family nonheme iron enzyme [Pseudomonas sp. ANT_J28]KAA0977221.1 formylglycine-generating enzyme family protein [Pseudomonas sp. ANT_J28]